MSRAHRRDGIRSIIYGVLVLGTFCTCGVITLRAYASWHKASERYRRIEHDVESLRAKNAELQAERDQLRNDPGTIESVARKRLHMVRPNDPVLLRDDPTFLTEHTSAELERQPISDGNSFLTYSVPVLYCGAAIIGGFVAAKCLIALLVLYVPRWNVFLHPARHSSQRNHGTNPAMEANTRSHLVWLFLFGLILTGGFIFAANKRFAEIAIKQRSEDLRSEHARLLVERQDLLLGVEQEQSPALLLTRARAIGMVSVTEEMLRRTAVIWSPSTESPRQSTKTEPSSSEILGAIAPPIASNRLLIILAIFGGCVAFMVALAPSFSRLLTGRGSTSIIIDMAPGSRYLLIVDFLFSPKDMEHTFKPIVADWRSEYFEALKHERIWKTRWISIRYTYRFIAAMGLARIYSLIKTLTRVGK